VSTTLVHLGQGTAEAFAAAGAAELREMVLNSVVSEHSKRNYAKALDEVFALCEDRKQPLSRALSMEYRAAMLEKKLSASTVNVRLSAVRKLIGEAQRNGIIGAEEAAGSVASFLWSRENGLNTSGAGNVGFQVAPI